MQVLVRADAGRDLGTGHVMRCLTLLDTLAAEALFVCTRMDGHLGDLIIGRGHRVHLLEPDISGDQDAVQTAALAVGADLVIVDHYLLDATWERVMPATVMVIDDLADRVHDCAVLLDQNLGRIDTDYDGLVPDACVLLTGPHYALLRPEFAAARPAALAARAARTGPAQHVMIVMGGTDAPNATGWVISQMAQMDLPTQMTVTAVLGATAPHLNAVRVSLAALPCKGELLVGTNRMADLMAQADFAVGAAGSTSWERCALGLPTVMVVLADNQKESAEHLTNAQAAVLITLNDCVKLGQVIGKMMTNRSYLRSIENAAANLVDGLGAPRVVDFIRGHPEVIDAN